MNRDLAAVLLLACYALLQVWCWKVGFPKLMPFMCGYFRRCVCHRPGCKHR